MVCQQRDGSYLFYAGNVPRSHFLRWDTAGVRDRLYVSPASESDEVCLWRLLEDYGGCKEMGHVCRGCNCEVEGAVN